MSGCHFREEKDEVADAVGVAPLVVVSADDLAGVADHLGQFGVEVGGERIALKSVFDNSADGFSRCVIVVLLSTEV